MTGIMYGYARVSTPRAERGAPPHAGAVRGAGGGLWNGRITATDAGRLLQVSRKTFTRRAEEWGQAAGLGRRGP